MTKSRARKAQGGLKKAIAKRAKKKTPEALLDELREFAGHARKQNHPVIIGIDPGQSGAIAFRAGNESLALEIPVLKVKKAGRKTKKTEYDYQRLAIYLHLFFDHPKLLDNTFVALEQSQIGGRGSLGSSKGKGKGGDTPLTAARTAWGCAIFVLLLRYVNARHALVPPSVWKKAMGLTGQDKEGSRRMAQQLFPKIDLSLVKDHGRAEALLLTEYARIKFSLDYPATPTHNEEE